MRHIGLSRLVLLSLWLITLSQPADAQRSRAMALDCKAAAANTPANRQKADQWVQEKLKAFLPAPDQSLRMKSMELQAEQVKLALGQIMMICEQYQAGKVSREDADFRLSGFEETIDNFLHDLGNEAHVTAARGQVSDLPAVQKTLTEIGGVGRQAALFGDDRLADEAQKKMVDALVSFSNTFVEQSCWDQSFDDDLPYAIHRQNEMLGTGIDVTPCAQRRFKAQVEVYTFESCTIRGVGDWRVRWNMAAPGTTGGEGKGELKAERDRAKGDYKVDWGANGVEYRASGDMELTRKDNGPGVKATYTLAGDMEIKLTKGKEKISKLEQLMGQKTKPTKGSFKVQPDVSDKPCKSLDE